MQYWLAYRRIQNPEDREQIKWDVKDKEEFSQSQSEMLFQHFERLGKEAVANKT